MWSHLFTVIAIELASMVASTFSADDFPDDTDLFTFVTRPNIRSPRFNSSILKPDHVTPGYWFTTPYTDLHSRAPVSLFTPGQIGPHIYDNNGELVWSGTHLYGNRPTFDFKVAEHDGSQFLTFIVMEDMHAIALPEGAGVFLDNSYRQVRTFSQRNGQGLMNFHEFNTMKDGKRALTITYASRFTEVVAAKSGAIEVKMFVWDCGFTEVDTVTGDTHFSWWALDHLKASESQVSHPAAPMTYERAWDFFHINSVDKDLSGDYLISGRDMHTIYKISGKNGSILWRLGGPKSDFKLEDFNMSSQHDARWLSQSKTSAVLTFFNNHADERHSTARTSSAVQVALDMETMTASLVHEWERPDGGLTRLRGNAQSLTNGNMFVGWSENAYVSEFDTAGDLVLEAKMASHRFANYRMYKFNFTAAPSEPIVTKAFIYGVSPETSTTVIYVSWNGATEVSRWKFWGASQDGPEHLGTVKRTGFETSHMVNGAFSTVMVEALDKSGQSLGRSQTVNAELPTAWVGMTATSKEFDVLGSSPPSDLGSGGHRGAEGLANGAGGEQGIPPVWRYQGGYFDGISAGAGVILMAICLAVTLAIYGIARQGWRNRKRDWSKINYS